MLESATSKQLWKINQLAWEYSELVEQLRNKGDLKLITQAFFPMSKPIAIELIKSMIIANEKIAELVAMEKENENEQKTRESLS